MDLDSIEVFAKFQVNKKSTRASATTPKLRKFLTIKGEVRTQLEAQSLFDFHRIKCSEYIA